MIIETILSKGLAHCSYFISKNGKAIVIDPRRDCLIYLQLAERECSQIEYILETHRNEDYVIGSVELQNLTDAEIAHSKELGFKYGDHNLADGEDLNVGDMKIEALSTPGHTNESMSYVLYESSESRHPLMVFTGDTLFVGNVGRTDLPGIDIWKQQSEKLYLSLHEKLLPLGDDVIIYPGHGTGSVCGIGISDRAFSTMGYEKKTNPLLGLNKDNFVDHMINQKMTRPPYFRMMENHNLNGAPLLRDVPTPKFLPVNTFEKELHQPNTVVIDTRMPGAFANSHIPGSLSIWLDGLSLYPGWSVTYDQRILLVTERKEDVEVAKAYLWRLGFDNIIGYLCPGIRIWRNRGKPIDKFNTLSPKKLKMKLDQSKVTLLDVREDHEWNEGHIQEANHIYVGYLKKKARQLPRDQTIVTTCAWGGRGSLAASILKSMGFKDVYNLLGGMDAWVKKEYPILKETN